MRAILLLAVAALLAPAPRPQDDAFELTYLAVHGRRQETVVFDFDGDGRPDLLNTAIDYDLDPPVRWFFLHLQKKDGTFPTKPDHLWPIPSNAAAMTK